MEEGWSETEGLERREERGREEEKEETRGQKQQ